MNYTTSSIMDMLAIEKEENSLVSRELLNETIAWIDLFGSYPEIEFDLGGEFEDFLPLLDNNKSNIEKTAAAFKKKLRRNCGRTPKPLEQVRTQHIGVYLTSAEMAKLANIAGTHKPEQMRGGDTSSRRKIAAYLRATGLRELQPIVPKLSIEVWSELSRSFENMNQVAKMSNGGVDLDEAYSLDFKTVRDILTSLRPQVDCLNKQ